jgi:hypothetical protein
LLYLGSLGTWYILDEMLRFYECLSSSVPYSCFIFLTQDQDLLKRKILEMGWINIIPMNEKDPEFYSKQGLADFPVYTFLRNNTSTDHLNNYSTNYGETAQNPNHRIIITQTTRELVPSYINLCDESILFIKSSYSKKASSATKAGEVWAMGKPLIVNKGWGDIEILIDKGYEYIISSLIDEEYYRVILNLIRLKETTNKFRWQKNILYPELTFGIKKYSEIYSELIMQSDQKNKNIH